MPARSREEKQAHTSPEAFFRPILGRIFLFLLTLALVAAGAFFFTQLKLEELTARERLVSGTTMYIPPARVLKTIVLGYAQLASDFYWLRAIQYYGEKANARENYRWLYPIMELVTDVDPRFAYAYKFSGVAIPYDAASAENANKILSKGLINAPKVWQIPFYIGYNYYVYLGDFAKAGDYISQASRVPGAPPFLAGLASRLYAEGGRPELALDFLIEIYNSVEDELLRKEIEKRIKEVMVERDLNFLNEAIKRFVAKEGREPRALTELMSTGILRALPREPFGGRYVYNPAKKEAESTMVKQRLRIFRGKK